MGGRSLVVVAAALCLLMTAVPAAAQTAAEPAITDGCGVEGLDDGQAEPPVPWHDICKVWVEPITGTGAAPGVRFTAEMAGDLQPRPTAGYDLSWSVGDCQYALILRDGAGVAGLGGRRLTVRCEPSVGPCYPTGVYACVSYEHFATVTVPPDAVREAGRRLTVEVVFAGAMQRYASDHTPGRTLAEPAAVAYSHAGGYPLAGYSCVRDIVGTCFSEADYAGPGADVTLGSAVAAVDAQVGTSCADSGLGDASAARPHAADEDDDLAMSRASGTSTPAADLWAAWASPGDDDAVVMHVLPSAPAAAGQAIAYRVDLAGRRWVRAELTNGTLVVRYGRGDHTLAGLPTSGTVNATTGLVSVVIPADGLPPRNTTPVSVPLTGVTSEVRADAQAPWATADTTAVEGLCAFTLPAVDEPWEPKFSNVATFFTCPGVPVGNAGSVATSSPSWTTERPQRSLLQGGGCASSDVPGLSTSNTRNPYDAAWSGVVSGNLDQMTVRMYLKSNPQPSDFLWGLSVGLTIDGTAVDLPLVDVRPVPTASGLDMVEFTIAGLGLDERGQSGEHDVHLSVDAAFNVTAWVYGAAEAPAGIEFNPPTVSSKVVRPRDAR